MCAFERKPNIDIDVKNISINNATEKYVFNSKGASAQLRYNHDAMTNFAASSAEPIAMIVYGAAGNIASNPNIEYAAAIPDNINPHKNNNTVKTTKTPK